MAPFNSTPISLGIDLGGTSLRVGLFDCKMKQLGAYSLATRIADGPQAAIADMAECVRSLLSTAPSSHMLTGIGVGSPGPLNLDLGTLGVLPNFPGWDGFPLRDSLARATGQLVYLESDANAAAAAEWKLGAGRNAKVDSLAMITLGTGVGSGLILDGRIWHGMVGMGGEVGHVSIDRDGPRCPCGSYGCLEMYASANGLMRLARAQANGDNGSKELKELVEQPGGFTSLDVAQLAVRGDIAATRSFEQLGKYLGFGVAGLISTLDLPLTIIGGGLSGAWSLFSPSMFAAIRKYSIVYRLGEPAQHETMERNKTFICPAELGASAGLLGAALVPSLLESTVLETSYLVR